MTSLLYAFSISISVYAITYISHIAKSSVCHIYVTLCFLLPCLICYFSQMKEPTYIILVVYISRIFLSELFIRFLHSFNVRKSTMASLLFLLDIQSRKYITIIQLQSSVTKIQVWQNDLYFVLNIPIPETFKLLDVLILTGLYYRNNVNFFRN